MDHLLTIGQSIGNCHGLGYIDVGNTNATYSKTLFVKVAPPIEVSPVFDKTFNSLPFRGKMKRFVFICHYCNMSGHILPRCFKYLNIFGMNRLVEFSYKPKSAPNTKIDLKIILLREYGLKIRFKLLHCLYFIEGDFY